MLKLQVKDPGEYLIIGDNIKVIFTGWTKNYLRIMVEAPKEINVVRSKAAEKAGNAEPGRYLSDKEMEIRELSRKVPNSKGKNGKGKNGEKMENREYGSRQSDNRKKKTVIAQKEA